MAVITGDAALAARQSGFKSVRANYYPLDTKDNCIRCISDALEAHTNGHLTKDGFNAAVTAAREAAKILATVDNKRSTNNLLAELAEEQGWQKVPTSQPSSSEESSATSRS